MGVQWPSGMVYGGLAGWQTGGTVMQRPGGAAVRWACGVES